MANFLASDSRVPGVRQFYNLVSELSLFGADRKVLLIGMRLTTADALLDFVPTRVTTINQAATLYGSGSQLALMAEAAFSSGKLSRNDATIGTAPQIWCSSIPAESGGITAASEHTLTINGSATANGSLTAWVGEQTVTIPVLSGEANTVIAARLNDSIDQIAPRVAYANSVASNVITFVANHFGAWGDELLLHVDTTLAPGITAATAISVPGNGLADVAPALSAVENEDFDCIVVGQDDSAVQTAVQSHIETVWDYQINKPRFAIIGNTGDLSDATTIADTLNDWRIMVCSGEKVAGATETYDYKESSRSHAWQLAAGIGARLLSQSRPNHNFNSATLAQYGRPNTLDYTTLNDAIKAGITVVLRKDSRYAKSYIVDPVSTAIRDQSQVTTASDWSHAPIEVAKVVAAVTKSIDLNLQGFVQLDASEVTRRDAESTAIGTLRQFAEQTQLLFNDADITAEIITLGGGAQALEIRLVYDVLVGLDIVGVEHNIRRA